MKMGFMKIKKHLIKELNIMDYHQFWIHSQYKAFKMAREESFFNSEVATTQIDWPENAKMR